jgi:glycosyltransferase involved in cell wall biosynthesis
MIDFQNPDFTNTPASSRRALWGYAPASPEAEPAVSLITPFFNAGAHFAETVESVLRQSLQQFEWIVVDDGSDDASSLDVLERQAQRDPRIRLVRTAGRQGPAAARNLGVRSARAPYAAFVDADDLLEPTALEKWLWYLDSHPQYGMVKGFQAGFGDEQYIWREGFHSGAAILERNIIQTASLVRRDLYLEAGGMDESIRGGMEDWDFWLKCAERGRWGGSIPEVLDWYRRRPSHHASWADWDRGAAEAAFRERLRRKYPRIFSGGFPQPPQPFQLPYCEIPEQGPCANRLLSAPGKRRVLMIVSQLVMGGAEKFNLDLIRMLIEQHDWQVTVAATLTSKHEWRHRFEELTPDVFTLDSFLRLCDYPRFLAYLVESRGIDSILVTWSQLGYQLLPYLRARFPHVRCCDYVHMEEPEWKYGGYAAYSIAYRAFLDRAIVSSQHLKNWIVAHGGDAGKTSVATTNIDPEDWRRDRFDQASLRAKWSVPPGPPVILFAGRICEQKQPVVLAETLRGLHERAAPFRCLVAGDGPDAPWLRAFVERRGLEEVRFLGSRSNEEMRELLALADIFFLPSKREGISLAVYEAMAMSAVVVGACVGGQKELLTPECGVLIQRSADEAATYVEVLSSLLPDAARLREMAANARRRVAEHFPLTEMGRQMAGLLAPVPGAPPFDFSSAFLTLAPTLAREAVEQRRTEQVAEHYWKTYVEAAPSDVSDGAVSPAGRSAKGRRGLAGRLLGYAALLKCLSGASQRGNRRLLLRILRRSGGRRALARAFDRLYYCYSYPDVPRFGVFPLLHYVFQGYREGRAPTAHCDHRSLWEGASAPENPMLRAILDGLSSSL